MKGLDWVLLKAWRARDLAIAYYCQDLELDIRDPAPTNAPKAEFSLQSQNAFGGAQHGDLDTQGKRVPVLPAPVDSLASGESKAIDGPRELKKLAREHST